MKLKERDINILDGILNIMIENNCLLTSKDIIVKGVFDKNISDEDVKLYFSIIEMYCGKVNDNLFIPRIMQDSRTHMFRKDGGFLMLAKRQMEESKKQEEKEDRTKELELLSISNLKYQEKIRELERIKMYLEVSELKYKKRSKWLILATSILSLIFLIKDVLPLFLSFIHNIIK